MTRQTTTEDTTQHAAPPRDSALSAVADADTLATVLDAVGAIVDECVLAVDDAGVSVEDGREGVGVGDRGDCGVAWRRCVLGRVLGGGLSGHSGGGGRPGPVAACRTPAGTHR
jgi:hypothetical protein